MIGEREATFERLEVVLTRDAINFSAHRPTPVDVVTILRELGIGLAIRESPLTKHPGMLTRDGRGWVVILNRKNGELNDRELSPFERFTMAHEIAHYLVEGRFGLRPETANEYWGLEEICNDFAGKLLMPDTLLERIKLPEKASDLLRAIQLLKRWSRVSTEAASRRFIPTLSLPVTFAQIVIEPNDKNSREGWVSWIVESKPWLGSGRKKSISTEDSLAFAVRAGLARSEGEEAKADIPGTRDSVVERGKGRTLFFAALHE